MKKAIIILAVAAMFTSCVKKEQCYTCFETNSMQLNDFCGTKKQLENYIEYRKSIKRPMECK